MSFRILLLKCSHEKERENHKSVWNAEPTKRRGCILSELFQPLGSTTRYHCVILDHALNFDANEVEIQFWENNPLIACDKKCIILFAVELFDKYIIVDNDKIFNLHDSSCSAFVPCAINGCIRKVARRNEAILFGNNCFHCVCKSHFLPNSKMDINDIKQIESDILTYQRDKKPFDRYALIRASLAHFMICRTNYKGCGLMEQLCNSDNFLCPICISMGLRTIRGPYCTMESISQDVGLEVKRIVNNETEVPTTAIAPTVFRVTDTNHNASPTKTGLDRNSDPKELEIYFRIGDAIEFFHLGAYHKGIVHSIREDRSCLIYDMRGNQFNVSSYLVRKLGSNREPLLSSKESSGDVPRTVTHSEGSNDPITVGSRVEYFTDGEMRRGTVGMINTIRKTIVIDFDDGSCAEDVRMGVVRLIRDKYSPVAVPKTNGGGDGNNPFAVDTVVEMSTDEGPLFVTIVHVHKNGTYDVRFVDNDEVWYGIPRSELRSFNNDNVQSPNVATSSNDSTTSADVTVQSSVPALKTVISTPLTQPQLNCRVEAKYSKNGKWFSGRLARINNDGTFDIVYDNNAQLECNVLRSDIIVIDKVNGSKNSLFRKGASVEVIFPGESSSTRWKPGKISASNHKDALFDVTLANGRECFGVKQSHIRVICEDVIVSQHLQKGTSESSSPVPKIPKTNGTSTINEKFSLPSNIVKQEPNFMSPTLSSLAGKMNPPAGINTMSTPPPPPVSTSPRSPRSVDYDSKEKENRSSRLYDEVSNTNTTDPFTKVETYNNSTVALPNSSSVSAQYEALPALSKTYIESMIRHLSNVRFAEETELRHVVNNLNSEALSRLSGDSLKQLITAARQQSQQKVKDTNNQHAHDAVDNSDIATSWSKSEALQSCLQSLPVLVQNQLFSLYTQVERDGEFSAKEIIDLLSTLPNCELVIMSKQRLVQVLHERKRVIAYGKVGRGSYAPPSQDDNISSQDSLIIDNDYNTNNAQTAHIYSARSPYDLSPSYLAPRPTCGLESVSESTRHRLNGYKHKLMCYHNCTAKEVDDVFAQQNSAELITMDQDFLWQLVQVNRASADSKTPDSPQTVTNTLQQKEDCMVTSTDTTADTTPNDDAKFSIYSEEDDRYSSRNHTHSNETKSALDNEYEYHQQQQLRQQQQEQQKQKQRSLAGELRELTAYDNASTSLREYVDSLVNTLVNRSFCTEEEGTYALHTLNESELDSLNIAKLKTIILALRGSSEAPPPPPPVVSLPTLSLYGIVPNNTHSNVGSSIASEDSPSPGVSPSPKRHKADSPARYIEVFCPEMNYTVQFDMQKLQQNFRSVKRSLCTDVGYYDQLKLEQTITPHAMHGSSNVSDGLMILKVDADGWCVEVTDSHDPDPAEAIHYTSIVEGDTLEVRRFGVAFVGGKYRLASIAAAEKYNQSLQEKVATLSKDYTGFRKIRGDGNCYYRAVFYGLIEFIILTNRREMFGQIHDCFKKVRYNNDSQSFIHDTLLRTILDAKAGVRWATMNDFDSELLKESTGLDDTLIRACKMTVARILIEDQDKVYNEMSIKDAILFTYDDCKNVREFNAAYVLQMEVCAEGIHVNLGLLPSALGCNCNIVILPREKDSRIATIESRCGDDHTANIYTLNLLLRPGHYDLLYTEDKRGSVPSQAGVTYDDGDAPGLAPESLVSRDALDTPAMRREAGPFSIDPIEGSATVSHSSTMNVSERNALNVPIKSEEPIILPRKDKDKDSSPVDNLEVVDQISQMSIESTDAEPLSPSEQLMSILSVPLHVATKLLLLHPEVEDAVASYFGMSIAQQEALDRMPIPTPPVVPHDPYRPNRPRLDLLQQQRNDSSQMSEALKQSLPTMANTLNRARTASGSQDTQDTEIVSPSTAEAEKLQKRQNNEVMLSFYQEDNPLLRLPQKVELIWRLVDDLDFDMSFVVTVLHETCVCSVFGFLFISRHMQLELPYETVPTKVVRPGNDDDTIEVINTLVNELQFSRIEVIDAMVFDWCVSVEDVSEQLNFVLQYELPEDAGEEYKHIDSQLISRTFLVSQLKADPTMIHFNKATKKDNYSSRYIPTFEVPIKESIMHIGRRAVIMLMEKCGVTNQGAMDTTSTLELKSKFIFDLRLHYRLIGSGE